jgi:hypothetical protein
MSELLTRQLKGSLALEEQEKPTTTPTLMDPTPMLMLQMAISKGVDTDQLTKLMDLAERFEANQARKAFVQAMADFKKEAIVIAKDKDNKQYGSKYTSMGELVGTVTPLLGKYGLSAEWTLDQSEGIKVGCTITHAFGHSGETKWMKVPLDSSGAKNPIQQLKSSVTYARILTLEMACGLASKEGSLDDDGTGTGDKGDSSSMSQDEFDYHMQRIEAAQNKNNLLVIFSNAYTAALKLRDEGAMKQFGEAKEKRKKELTCE